MRVTGPGANVHCCAMGLGEGEGDGEGCVGTVVLGGAGDGITVGLSPQLGPINAAPTITIQIA